MPWSAPSTSSTYGESSRAHAEPAILAERLGTNNDPPPD